MNWLLELYFIIVAASIFIIVSVASYCTAAAAELWKLSYYWINVLFLSIALK